MKVSKTQPFAVFRNEDNGSYEIYASFDDLHEAGVEPLVTLCSEWFEAFTGVSMDEGEVAEITLRPSRIFTEETKIVPFKIRKS